ncbi:MAG: hypothetical protein WCI43_00355 [Candidatus Firestonebacteria bacterium]
MAYADNTGSSASAIYLKSSVDSGFSWSAPLTASDRADDSLNPSVTAGAGEIHLVYDSGREGSSRSVKYISSSDKGVSWSLPVQLSRVSSDSRYPKAVLGQEGAVYSAWQSGSAVYFRKGQNNGRNWTDEVLLASSIAKLGGICSSGSNIAVYWTEGSPKIIKAALSGDSGVTWNLLQFSSNISPEDALEPNICGDGAGGFLSVWRQSGGAFEKTCFKSGGPSVSVSGGIAGQIAAPTVAVNPGGRVSVFWIDNRDGERKLYSAESLDGGVVFGNNKAVCAALTTGEVTPVGISSVIHLVRRDSAQLFNSIKDETAPPLPVIGSLTHKAGVLSAVNRPIFSWESLDNEAGSGIAGFSYLLDKEKSSLPPEAINYTSQSLGLPQVENGAWWFHLRAVDRLGNWSGAAHYGFSVYSSSLLPVSEIWCAPNPVKSGNPRLRFYIENDSSVLITLFNETGAELAKVERKFNAGVNTVTDLDTSGWANGFYCFRITAKSSLTGVVESAVKKIVLAR